MTATRSAVHGTVTSAQGGAQDGARVRISLIPSPGFVAGDSVEIIEPIEATASDGVWSVSLYGNSDIAPDSSYYQATYLGADGSVFGTSDFLVPAGGGTYWIGALVELFEEDDGMLTIGSHSTDFTVPFGEGLSLIDTTSGNLTVTLPAVPVPGETHILKKVSVDENVVIVAGGTVEGNGAGFLFYQPDESVTLCFVSVAVGWVIV